MKKYWLFVSVMFVASLFIVSCGSSIDADDSAEASIDANDTTEASIDADAKKLAEYLCQEMELMEEGSWAEYDALEEEIDAFIGELEEKYNFDDYAFDKKFEEAVKKAFAELDCDVDDIDW